MADAPENKNKLYALYYFLNLHITNSQLFNYQLFNYQLFNYQLFNYSFLIIHS